MSIDKKKWIEIFVYFVILTAGLCFVLWISRMTFQNTAIDLSEQSVQIQTAEVVEQIETAVHYGKEITNFYGISEILNGVTQIDGEAIGVLLTDADGKAVSAQFPDTDESGDTGREMLSSVYASDVLEPDSKQSISDGDKISLGDYNGQIFPIEQKDGTVDGYLFVIYEKGQLIEKLPVLPFVGVMCIILLVVAALLAVSMGRLHHKALPVIFVMAGMFVFMSFLYLNFRNEYKLLIEKSASTTQAYLQKEVDALLEKGLPLREIHGLDNYFKSIADRNDAVESIAVDEVGNVSVVVNYVLSYPYIRECLKMLMLTFGAVFVVCLMVAYELTFLAPVILSREKRKAVQTSAAGMEQGEMAGMIRVLAFLAYTAIYTSMPYAAVIMRSENMSLLGMSVAFSSSLPLTVELLSVLVVSLLIQRTHARERLFRLFLLSVSVLAAGNLACMRASSPYQILCLRAFCGIGFAFLKFFLNSLIAAGSEKEEELKTHFAYMNAGLLGGITVGSSLGSILAGTFGYYGNYLFTAVLAGLVFLMGMAFIPWKSLEEKRSRQTGGEKLPSLLLLFRAKSLRKAIILTDLPLNIGLMYVVAFLPVYMGAIGQPAVATSYAYLVNGVAGVYVGVWMLRLLKKLANRQGVAAALFLAAVGILVLLLGKNAFVVIVSAAIMGLFDGYGTPTLTSFFTGLSEKEQGDNAGLLTLYGSIGSAVQIICPILYGFLASDNGSMLPVILLGAAYVVVGLRFMFPDKELE